MKKQYFLTATILLFMSFLTLNFSCKKSNKDHPDPDNNSGTTTDGLEQKEIDNKTLKLPVDSGDIGVIIDLRNLFRQGYKPSYISVEIQGDLSNLSNSHLSVNPNTSLAIIKVKRNTLSADQIQKAAVGPKVIIKVYNSENKKLTEIDKSSLPINNQSDYFEIPPKSKSKHQPLSLNSKIPYIIQESKLTNNQNEAGVLTYLGNSIAIARNSSLDKKNPERQEFYFIPVHENDPNDDSTFYIKTSFKGDNDSKDIYLNIYNNYSGETLLFANYDPPYKNNTEYQFILRDNGDGWINIKPVNYPVLKDVSPQFSPYPNANNQKPAKFKVFTAGIKWDVKDLGTALDEPILPPQKLELAVSTQLINCTSGELSQTLGEDNSREQTTTVESTETFQLTTSEETSISINTSVSAEGSFFGVGASASVDIGSEFSFGREITSTKENSFSNSKTKSKSISTSRTINVKPHTGVNVYDAIETYHNVKIPFVQKLRVAGTYDKEELTGKEIADQLLENQFGGVVSEIGSTYVIVTVRGNATIDNFMKVRSKSEDIPDACSVN